MIQIDDSLYLDIRREGRETIMEISNTRIQGRGIWMKFYLRDFTLKAAVAHAKRHIHESEYPKNKQEK